MEGYYVQRVVDWLKSKKEQVSHPFVYFSPLLLLFSFSFSFVTLFGVEHSRKMRRQYASSVYSQKSTTSAKSGRSFLSLTTPIWPSIATNDISIQANSTNNNDAKQGVWQNLKSWMPSTTTAANTTGTLKKKNKNDSDSITTTRSSSSSISKLKQLFNKKRQSGLHSNSPRASLDIPSSTATTAQGEDEEEDASSSTTTSIDNIKRSGPIGILVNSTESTAEAIEERKRRRRQRREHILKLQKQNRSLQHYHFTVNNNNNMKELASPIESSSSDTLLTDSPITTTAFTTTATTTRKMVGFNVGGEEDEVDNDWGYYNPRIMFVEPSPVPRFRNVAPPPPPSPPYLNILVNDEEEEDNITNESRIHHVIKSPGTDDDDIPTVYTTQKECTTTPTRLCSPTMEQPLYDEEEMSLLMNSLKPKPIPRLYFNQPLYRGQVLKFSLQNAIPEDHIILFKFLTSNNNNNPTQQERYFVRPSAGKMVSTDQKEIVLFLNQVPEEMIKKDKIMIRWAVIQKNTQIEQWVNTLSESTRKKWIDMLDEEWPDQVTIRMTRIKIRFV